jgi:hypothetical protein
LLERRGGKTLKAAHPTALKMPGFGPEGKNQTASETVIAGAVRVISSPLILSVVAVVLSKPRRFRIGEQPRETYPISAGCRTRLSQPLPNSSHTFLVMEGLGSAMKRRSPIMGRERFKSYMPAALGNYPKGRGHCGGSFAQSS